jgi:hypothetical protein
MAMVPASCRLELLWTPACCWNTVHWVRPIICAPVHFRIQIIHQPDYRKNRHNCIIIDQIFVTVSMRAISFQNLQTFYSDLCMITLYHDRGGSASSSVTWAVTDRSVPSINFAVLDEYEKVWHTLLL